MIYMLFFRSGLRQKSPSVVLLEIEPMESAIEADAPDDIADESVETSQDLDVAGSEDITEIEIAETETGVEMDWDPDSEDPELLDDLATDEKSVGVTNKTPASNELKTAAVESNGEDSLPGKNAPNAEDQASDLDNEDVAESVDEADTELVVEETIAEDTDSEDTTELVVDQDEEVEKAIAEDTEDNNSEDTTEAIAEEDAESEVEEEEETEPVLTDINSEFNSGVFTVGASGEVAIDLLFDGGKYKGELAIFSLNGMEEFEPGSEEFIREAASRALSNSTSGYVVFSDQTEGAKFSGELGDKNYNAGDYLGMKTFAMTAGDQFGFMLVANGRVQQVFDNPDVGGALRPLFSMATANPEDAFHVGQIADVTGNGNTFVMEDMRIDGGSDKDYNDIIFQVRGATGNVVNVDEVIDPAKDWRDSDLGKEIIGTPDLGNGEEVVIPPETIDPPLPIDPLTGTEYIPGAMMLKFDSTATEAEILAFAQSQGAITVENLFEQETNNNSQWKVLQFAPDQDLVEVRTAASQELIVSVVELDYKLTISNISRDSMANSLWGLNNTGQTGGLADADIDLPEAWRTQTGSKAITVAVIDTGGDYRHPDLAANTWRNQGEVFGNGVDDDRNGFVDDIYGYDFVNRDGDPMDDQGHGTHVAGTIGAVGNNNLGLVGVNQNVSLMHLKFLSSQGTGSTIDAVRSVDYATRMGANVINASFGGGGYSQAMFDAISRANDAGILFVAAAGNESNNNDFRPSFPANYDLPNVISVAATDHRDQLARFSNFGQNSVDLGAPGVNILSTLPGNRYGSFDGTSMAAPHVAGAAALLLAENSNQTPNQVKNLLMRTADPVTFLQGRTVTGGRLNVNRALSQITPPSPQRPVWEVAIDEAYARSPVNLGRPLHGYLDATRSPQGTNGKCRAYEYGTIHWTPQHGAVPLWLDLQREYSEYASPNGSGGWLGFPTKIEYPWNGGMRTDFEGGYIFWNGQRAKAYRNGQLPDSNITWVPFTGIVGPSIGINLRYSQQFSDRSPWSEPYGKRLEFDAWTYGETGTDMWTGTPDARWFKVKGRDLWVPSCWINGNPPNSQPMPPSLSSFDVSATHGSLEDDFITTSNSTIRVVPRFNGWVMSTVGANVRSGASTTFPRVGFKNYRETVTFDAWTYGQRIADVQLGTPDERWYRIAGTSQWIASALIFGNAPGSTPLPVTQPISSPINWNSPAYRQNNPLWNAGFAPKSENPPRYLMSNPNAKGNCTWYANGRLRELGYSSRELDRLVGNAADWDNQAQAAGIPISRTPTVGSIAQWESNHVAVVEQVNSDGTIVISESSYWPTSPHQNDYLYKRRTISATNPSRYIQVRR